MNRLLCSMAGTVVLAVSTTVGAQEPADGAEAAEVEQQLEAARQRLEEAAREVAQLTGRLVGGPSRAFVHRLGPPPRARLGMQVVGSEDGGVEVREVTPGGPAARAGLVAGDVLTEIDGKRLDAGGAHGVGSLLRTLAGVEPGADVTLRYRRDGEEAEVSVTTEAGEAGVAGFGVLGHFDGPGGGSFDLQIPLPPLAEVEALPMEGLPMIEVLPAFVRRWGQMELVAMSPGLGRYFGTDEGLLVVRAPKDPILGLEDGDVILSIDGRRPENPAHGLRILNSYAPGERLELEVMRQQRRRVLEVELPKPAEEALRAPRPTPAPPAV